MWSLPSSPTTNHIAELNSTLAKRVSIALDDEVFMTLKPRVE